MLAVGGRCSEALVAGPLGRGRRAQGCPQGSGGFTAGSALPPVPSHPPCTPKLCRMICRLYREICSLSRPWCMPSQGANAGKAAPPPLAAGATAGACAAGGCCERFSASSSALSASFSARRRSSSSEVDIGSARCQLRALGGQSSMPTAIGSNAMLHRLLPRPLLLRQPAQQLPMLPQPQAAGPGAAAAHSWYAIDRLENRSAASSRSPPEQPCSRRAAASMSARKLLEKLGQEALRFRPVRAGPARCCLLSGGRRRATPLRCPPPQPSRTSPLIYLQVAGSWHKPAISAKNAARLRKETLAEGGEWAYERAAEPARRRKPKGHKHDREKPLRCADG